MTDTTARAGEPAPEEELGTPTDPLAAPDAPDETGALAQETAELKDRLLRTLAEMENLRRRTQR